KIVLMNLNFEIICDRIFEFDMSYKIDDLIGKISDEIKKIMTIMNIESEKIIGIGFSLPGMVNEETKMLEIAANLGVSDVDFNRYTDMFDFPVFVENESNAAAYAEYKVGVCRHRKDMVYISVNEGVGAGVIADNKIYKGFKKRAGEIGHMTIYKHGLPCVCGRLGCWNAYVSTYALLNAYISAGGESITTLREFFVLYHEGNVTAVNIWEKYVEDMSVGIQNVILIFDPHYIVIGGEIANYSEELLNPLKKAVFKGNGFVREQDVSILISELKEDASSIGAALIPLNKFMDVEEIY
ncbi:MAG: ROK family protein, partial [Christensenella sp.]